MPSTPLMYDGSAPFKCGSDRIMGAPERNHRSALQYMNSERVNQFVKRTLAVKLPLPSM